jgi:hypothetical protein
MLDGKLPLIGFMINYGLLSCESAALMIPILIFTIITKDKL